MSKFVQILHLTTYFFLLNFVIECAHWGIAENPEKSRHIQNRFQMKKVLYLTVLCLIFLTFFLGIKKEAKAFTAPAWEGEFIDCSCDFDFPYSCSACYYPGNECSKIQLCQHCFDDCPE